MLKRLLGLMVIIMIVFYQSIFSQADNSEPNINGDDNMDNNTTAQPMPRLPEVRSAPAVVPKRDPFNPILRDIGLSTEFYTLKKYDVRQYILVGILYGVASPKARFEAPDGTKYTLKKGDEIGRNGGIIMQIDNGQVVILERIRNYDGSIKEDMIVRSLKNAS
jgi:hypothetical protein